jgi:hypothetical protein
MTCRARCNSAWERFAPHRCGTQHDSLSFTSHRSSS